MVKMSVATAAMPVNLKHAEGGRRIRFCVSRRSTMVAEREPDMAISSLRDQAGLSVCRRMDSCLQPLELRRRSCDLGLIDEGLELIRQILDYLPERIVGFPILGELLQLGSDLLFDRNRAV